MRPGRRGDVAAVMAIDNVVTGLAKPDYWNGLYGPDGTLAGERRHFFVAESAAGKVVGFVIGEVRAWEFGSTPCGWVFAISVDASAREHRVGERLLQAISEAFKRAGMDKMRTMISRNNVLLMSFFRSEGMMAGPYIQLEKDLD